ncbi:hypothetical protein BGW80DRAFT_1254811 [Lactifluus volemus]|nr:hypothetical protein BGW80DRAFT_1254811 [Lactifluus volemus]
MQDDTAGAQRFLKLNLREHVAWERNTVWRQMIGRERRGQGGTPLGAPVDTTEEKAFEAISLFVTSTMVPALLTWLRVIRDADTNERLSPVEATRRVGVYNCGGGFKDEPRRTLITRVLSLGTRPIVVLLAVYGCRMFRQHVDQACRSPPSLISRAIQLAIALAANTHGFNTWICVDEAYWSQGELTEEPPRISGVSTILDPPVTYSDLDFWSASPRSLQSTQMRQ